MFGAVQVSGDTESEPIREYVGEIWVGGEPGQRIRVFARSLIEATAQVERTYGEGHVMTIYNEDDADRRR
jgi:hypothetical protein